MAEELKAGLVTSDAASGVPDVISVLPLRDTVLFPHAMLPLAAGRETSITLIEDAVRAGAAIGAFGQLDPALDQPQESDLHRVGTYTSIHKVFRQQDGSVRMAVQGLTRIRLLEVVQTQPFLRARVEEVPDIMPAPGDLETEALTSRPDVFRATTQERLTREAVTMARAGYYPQAALQGVYEFNGGTFTSRASSWTIGAVFRWNVFGGLADAARVGEARAANDRARADRESQETAVRVDIRVAVARVEESRAREVVGRSAQAQATESQRIVRDRYEAGLATVNDVLRAANAVLDAESQHTAALVDVLVSAAMLERARGR